MSSRACRGWSGAPPIRPARVLVSLVAAALVIGGCALPRIGPNRSAGSTPAGSSEWQTRSTPLAIEYLRTLPDAKIGTILPGIALADGERWLEGFRLLGHVDTGHPGLHVVVLVPPDTGEPLTLMWIEPDGEAWPLSVCSAEEEPGIRARTLSGEIYTWKSLQPGGGIISYACPPNDWPRPGRRGPGSI